jgi:ATP-dependent Lon protease
MQQNIKDGISGHAVNWYSDVFNIVFSDLDKEAANSIWKAQLTKPADANQRNNHEDD